MHLVLEDVGKNLYFLTFIPKLHILSTRGKRVECWLFLDTFPPFWRTSLLKWKTINKFQKLRHINTYLECGLCYFILSMERLQNDQKLTKKHNKKAGAQVPAFSNSYISVKWKYFTTKSPVRNHQCPLSFFSAIFIPIIQTF